jgi:hypothetical protein
MESEHMENLDAKLAYQAMFCFLEKYYELTQADDVGALLGSMTLLDDGMPVDAAIWRDWLDAIERVAISR